MDRRFIYAFTFLFFGLFIIEHVARINNYDAKPSFLINKISIQCEKYWYLAGELVARLCSLSYFSEFAQTASDLVKPILSLVLSPLQFMSGYFYVVARYKYPILILTASLLFGLSFYYCCSRGYFRKLCGILKPKKN